METGEAAARWARTWHDGWEVRDTDAVMALYAQDSWYSSEAFREPIQGWKGVRQFVERVFSEERGPRVWVGEPIVSGDRAAIEWWATVVENDLPISLAGVSILRFDAAGLVSEQWDSWNQGVGFHEPPAGWGGAASRG
jgi:nuclear transport factor 2 (NTF2) superfamily protein